MSPGDPLLAAIALTSKEEKRIHGGGTDSGKIYFFLPLTFYSKQKWENMNVGLDQNGGGLWQGDTSLFQFQVIDSLPEKLIYQTKSGPFHNLMLNVWSAFLQSQHILAFLALALLDNWQCDPLEVQFFSSVNWDTKDLVLGVCGNKINCCNNSFVLGPRRYGVFNQHLPPLVWGKILLY